MAPNIVYLENVTKEYDGNTVLDNVTMGLDEGKFYTLLGPSGCGKTTILRIIAGFTDASDGVVYFNGEKINDLHANKRHVNTVFQNYALFPHLNVFENVAFGLRIKKVSKEEIEKRVNESLKFVSLEGYGPRNINNLSGGQKQRVALARAIVNQPKVLLLDEPLSALDLKLRTEMQYELRDLQRRLGITFVFVTHDQEEALAMSDEIFVLNEGKIIQRGTPNEIYDEPINRYVADFIGESNIIPAKMLQDKSVEFCGKVFDCLDGGFSKNEPVEVIIRPEDMQITSESQGRIRAKVDSQLFRGVHYEIFCIDDDGNGWLVHSTSKAKVGDEIGLDFDAEVIHVMGLNETEEQFENRRFLYRLNETEEQFVKRIGVY